MINTVVVVSDENWIDSPIHIYAPLFPKPSSIRLAHNIEQSSMSLEQCLKPENTQSFWNAQRLTQLMLFW